MSRAKFQYPLPTDLNPHSENPNTSKASQAEEKSMAESRKRKQRSLKSNPLAGVYTRSKSQIYVHQHRSGYSRADATRNPKLALSLEATPKSIEQLQQTSEAADDQITAQISVKDLRMRRVFSPTSIADGVVTVENPDMGVDLKIREPNIQNPKLSYSEEESANGDLGISVAKSSIPILETPDPYPVRENPVVEADNPLQMTTAAPEIGENMVIRGQNDTKCAVTEMVGNKASITKGQSPISTSRTRRKVFKSPSSFSYRRLLPYLMDIGKDDQESSKIEIVEVTLPRKVQKSNNMVIDVFASKDKDIGAESDGRKPADIVMFDSSMNLNLVRTNGSLGLPDVEKESHDNGLNDSMEEHEQMTPPDPDIYSKPKIDKSLDVLVKPSDRTFANLSTKSNGSISASKLVLNPCSRMKVLQTPSSFSHRRLLPFLTKIARDDSLAASKVDKCSEFEKDVEQNLHPPPLSLLHQDTPVAEFKTKSSAPESSTGLEKLDLVAASKVDKCSEFEKDVEQNPHPPPLSLLHQDTPMAEFKTKSSAPESSTGLEKLDSPTSILTQVSSDNGLDATGPEMDPNFMCLDELASQSEMKSPAEEVKSDSSRKLNIESHNKDLNCDQEENVSALSLVSITSLETLPNICTVQSSKMCTPDTNSDFMGSKNSYGEVEGKPVMDNVNQHSSEIISFDSSGIHGANFRKGILRRNPRGCRGLCNCLNCLSFRLHAERAFEFSRNQMHDTEEVILELIKDLTCLRTILGKTVADSDLDAVHLKQVKEACANAMHTEELAKMRLVQMNEDLNIHCRGTNLHPPKVSFANKVEEKTISEAGWPK